MCARYTLTRTEIGEILRQLAAEIDSSAEALHLPRYNAAPGQPCIIARGGTPVVMAALWGLRFGGRTVVNLRAENGARHRGLGRCVVPSDGFYEWTGARGDRRPIWFRRPSGELMMMAALLQEPADGLLPAFAIATVPARPPVSRIHDRMPLLMGAEQAVRWLGGRRRAEPEAIELVGVEVSRRVNSAANDDAGLVEPAEPDRQIRLL